MINYHIIDNKEPIYTDNGKLFHNAAQTFEF